MNKNRLDLILGRCKRNCCTVDNLRCIDFAVTPRFLIPSPIWILLHQFGIPSPICNLFASIWNPKYLFTFWLPSDILRILTFIRCAYVFFRETSKILINFNVPFLKVCNCKMFLLCFFLVACLGGRFGINCSSAFLKILKRSILKLSKITSVIYLKNRPNQKCGYWQPHPTNKHFALKLISFNSG